MRPTATTPSPFSNTSPPTRRSSISTGNDEYPAVPGVALSESVGKLGDFKADDVDLSAVATNLPTAQKIFNEVGWK